MELSKQWLVRTAGMYAMPHGRAANMISFNVVVVVASSKILFRQDSRIYNRVGFHTSID